jgi:hypothetical protein
MIDGNRLFTQGDVDFADVLLRNYFARNDATRRVDDKRKNQLLESMRRFSPRHVQRAQPTLGGVLLFIRIVTSGDPTILSELRKAVSRLHMKVASQGGFVTEATCVNDQSWFDERGAIPVVQATIDGMCVRGSILANHVVLPLDLFLTKEEYTTRVPMTTKEVASLLRKKRASPLKFTLVNEKTQGTKVVVEPEWDFDENAIDVSAIRDSRSLVNVGCVLIKAPLLLSAFKTTGSKPFELSSRFLETTTILMTKITPFLKGNGTVQSFKFSSCCGDMVAARGSKRFFHHQFNTTPGDCGSPLYKGKALHAIHVGAFNSKLGSVGVAFRLSPSLLVPTEIVPEAEVITDDTINDTYMELEGPRRRNRNKPVTNDYNAQQFNDLEELEQRNQRNRGEDDQDAREAEDAMYDNEANPEVKSFQTAMRAAEFFSPTPQQLATMTASLCPHNKIPTFPLKMNAANRSLLHRLYKFNGRCRECTKEVVDQAMIASAGSAASGLGFCRADGVK